MNYKLGKKAPKIDERIPMFAQLKTPSFPAPPRSASWLEARDEWGMMLNDKFGCCTIAATGHAIQVFTMATWDQGGSKLVIPDSEILHYYETWDGYVPGRADTDQGGVMADVLTHWKNAGFGKHKIVAFCKTAVGHVEHLKQGIAFFGGIRLGFNVTQAMMDQFDDGAPWEMVADDGGSLGGHDVFAAAYDEDYLEVITWARRQKMAWSVFEKYTDESYVPFSAGWFPPSLTHYGFKTPDLLERMKALR